MIKIVWVTPISFIDNNIELVPYLSKIYKIHWVILANKYPSVYDRIKKMKSETLTTEYYEDSVKWYSPKKFFSIRSFLRHLIELNGDIIYINNAPQLWSYYSARMTLPKDKVVLALHNAKIPKGARNEHLARYYMRKVICNFHNFQVFSLNQKEYLEEHSEGKNILFARLPLLNYGPIVEKNDNFDKPNFLAFGFIRKYKRFDLLIEAAQLLYEETKQSFSVTIAGTCNNWDYYQKLIKYPELFNLKIGYINDEDVAHYFANCDYLVQPYQDLAQSGPLMLAFFYHVPVIASDIPPFKEFIEEGVNGFFFKSESVESLKNLMKILLNQTQGEREAMKLRVAKYAQDNHSFEALGKQYKAFFDKFSN